MLPLETSAFCQPFYLLVSRNHVIFPGSLASWATRIKARDAGNSPKWKSTLKYLHWNQLGENDLNCLIEKWNASLILRAVPSATKLSLNSIVYSISYGPIEITKNIYVSWINLRWLYICFLILTRWLCTTSNLDLLLISFPLSVMTPPKEPHLGILDHRPRYIEQYDNSSLNWYTPVM